ncbi:MAG: PHP domain-containing protein [Candidatus Aminicenantes bacterium]|nr:PHP domain-containing protein [Candidatus Aminicenantes bacterium]
MAESVDLHIHSSKSSDGDFSPSHIVHLAKEEGLRAISITDHDTVAAYPEALNIGEEIGLEVIPGVELTTLFADREFHLLLFFVDWKREIVKELVKEVADRRCIEAKDRVNKLQKLGFAIEWEEVLQESAPNPPLGVTIAQVLLKKAENNDPLLEKYLDDANKMYAPYLFYKDYFADGRPASVPRQNVNLKDVLALAPQTRGVPVLAHPGAPFERVTKEDLEVLKGLGLQGLEVYTSYHDASMATYYKGLAETLDLVPTAGSDFHGRIKPQVPFGSLKNGGYWMVEELRKRRSL